jgi:hypothetical protein
MLTHGVPAGQRGAAGVTLRWRRHGFFTAEHFLAAALPALRFCSTHLPLAHMSPVPFGPRNCHGACAAWT